MVTNLNRGYFIVRHSRGVYFRYYYMKVLAVVFVQQYASFKKQTVHLNMLSE